MTTHSQSTSRLNLGKKQEEKKQEVVDPQAPVVEAPLVLDDTGALDDALMLHDPLTATEAQPLAPMMEIPSFQGVRLNQIIRKDGTKWLPNADGYFVPSNMEEAESVEYYVSIGRMVQVIKY